MVVARAYCSDTKYKLEEDEGLLAFLLQQMDLALGIAAAVFGFVLFLFLFLYRQYNHTS